MKEQFLPHALVSPVEIWEILMEWNHDIRHQRQNLRVGETGNAGPGNPVINALVEVIDGLVGAIP